ncbi:MAG: helix-turn-helix domain-containing protein, partial [Gammaproteobacteria bacterium]|nr:helix-turn-helix domain-containing protein [Gammaproteobacteria bacterium]
MSWLETCPMNERVKFIMAYQKEPDSFKTLCERFNVSRKTGYKWLSRFEEQGFGGLQDRSRAPNRVANKLDKDCRQQILSVKCKHMDWGPRKIIAWLEQEYPSQEWPVPSTAGLLLKQHGLVKARKLRRYVEPYRQPFADCDGPNAVWSIDYKGQFKLQNGQLCYPLTLTDN